MHRNTNNNESNNYIKQVNRHHKQIQKEHREFINKLEEVGWKYHKLQYLPIGKYDYLSWRNAEIEKLLKQPDSPQTKNKLLKLGYSRIQQKMSSSSNTGFSISK